MATADVVVVGLGAMGSASLYQLARRGVRVTGIDRFAPPHDRGSSHAESRITRQGVGEGAPRGSSSPRRARATASSIPRRSARRSPR